MRTVSSRSLLIVLGCMLLSFQNCSPRFSVPGVAQQTFATSSTAPSGATVAPATATSATPIPALTSSQADSYYELAQTTKGNGITTAFQGQTGAYFWGKLPVTPAVAMGKPFENPVQKIINSGFNTIRVAIGDQTAGYGLSFPNGAPTSLAAWLQVREMRDLLLNSAFPLVALTATDLTSGGRPTVRQRFNDPSFRLALFNEYYAFFAGLYQLPVESKRTFVISNWEGDNQIYQNCAAGTTAGASDAALAKCNADIVASEGQSLNDVIDAYIMWSLVRKAAFLAAKELTVANPNIDIRFGIEFDQLNAIPPSRSRSVFWNVVPAVKPDVVLYSSYESVTKGTLTADIAEVRTNLNAWGLNNTVIAIGEIGHIGTPSVQQTNLRQNLITVGLSDVAFAFPWNAFNESATETGDWFSMGLWMPDGSLQVAPTTGLLVPKLGTIADVANGCFSSYSTTCELTVPGQFPDYALNAQSADIRCDGNATIHLSARYVTPAYAAVSLPGTLRGQSCQLRFRSDIGLASDWSNTFSVGLDTAAAPTTSFDTSVAGYDIIVIGGQSNSSNAGLGDRADPLAGQNDQRIFQLTCDDLNENFRLDANEPSGVLNATDFIHDCEFDRADFHAGIVNSQRQGFGISFARQYAKYKLAANRKVLIVAGGVSSSGSPDWAAGGADSYLENLLTRVNSVSAQPGSHRVVAFLWAQGEADILWLSEAITGGDLTRTGSSSVIDSYATTLAGIIQRARAALNTPNLPFLITEKAPQWQLYQVEKLRYQDTDRWISQTTSNTAIVRSDNLPSNPICLTNPSPFFCDTVPVHFSAQSMIDLGARFYQSYLSLRP